MALSGQKVDVVNVDREMTEFDQRLRRPLNFDRQREALLQEAASA